MVLGQWDPVSASFISFADDNWLVMTCDEYIFLFMYVDTILCEDVHVPSSDVLPTLSSVVGNYSNVSADAALLESCGDGIDITHLPF